MDLLNRNLTSTEQSADKMKKGDKNLFLSPFFILDVLGERPHERDRRSLSDSAQCVHNYLTII